MHSMKTGAMVACSVALGGIVAGASSASRQALDVYAQAMGLAFQVVDDILDVTADSASLGDAGRTPPRTSHLRVPAGPGRGARLRRELRSTALAALEPLGDAARAWPSWPISSYFGIADP